MVQTNVWNPNSAVNPSTAVARARVSTYATVTGLLARLRTKEDPGPKPEVLTGQDYTSCVDHRFITTSQDFECHSLGGVDTPDLRDWPLRLREARGAGGPEGPWSSWRSAGPGRLAAEIQNGVNGW